MPLKISNIENIAMTEKFKKGLMNYGLSFEEITNGNWKYCGGNEGRHYRYFKMMDICDKLPLCEEKCVCGHKITENCYITNGEQILVLGNCCIKRFIPKNTRTCQECGKPHLNRKYNFCNKCNKICLKCGKELNKSGYKYCSNCSYNHYW